MGKDTATGKIDAAIDKRVKKAKQTCKRICCCTFWWFFLGIVCIVVAIILLVYFAQYWSDETSNKRYTAYAAVVVFFVGILMTAIGVSLCVLLWKYYNKLSGRAPSQLFRPPTYAPGKAPYPQQPQLESNAAQMDPNNPSAPLAPGPVQPDEVKVDVNPKF